ncbi:hypothetical protein [Falsiroseomonas selenitidurans]|uniref:Sulfotransferase domain-containing protein n=1 Tax=Falsiroseomonas selenitidurans TaxID=2716335 RepID=A0ABX1E0B7_9PROT|nr:hypothetical protein [Falsiroseomonas selenitidurans]NKC30590.1 hypothetical protein [Falsiroseomonas selenitidurans]
MKIVFHVGMPKAGSTSIQLALASARDSLIEQGIYFNVADPSVASDYLIYDLAMRRDAKCLNDLLSRRAEQAIGHGCSTVMLSAERIFSIAGHPDEFQGLLDALRGNADTVEFIMVSRSLTDVLRSYLEQIIYNGSLSLSDNRLAPWWIACAKSFWNLPERVCSVSFELAGQNGGLIQCFFDALGITVSAPDIRANRTPPRSLAFATSLGIICQAEAKSRSVDVNSPMIDQLRTEITSSFDSFLSSQPSEETERVLGYLDQKIRSSLEGYIVSSSAIAPDDDIIFYENLYRRLRICNLDQIPTQAT